MMRRSERYRTQLQTIEDWKPFLLQASGLPGPRANLELVQAVANEGTEPLFRHYLAYTADIAPGNTPEEFLPVCGVVGLGRLLAEGRIDLLPIIRAHASDSRWRMREGVCMALQRWGDIDMAGLIVEMAKWATGNFLEQRAAAATLCEPRLLGDAGEALQALRILDQITTSITEIGDRRSDSFIVLRKGLAYCWSVAVAALPEAGEPLMEKWFTSSDKDIRWIMKQNLEKKRLSKVDGGWVQYWKAKL